MTVLHRLAEKTMELQNLDIYFLRHGQTQWNVSKRVQGRLDSTLTEKGENQAYLQGKILSQRLDTLQRKVFCSPLGRTRQTAEIILKENTLDIHFDDRLVEIGVGDWEGTLQDELKINHPEMFITEPTFLSLYGAAPNGEGFENLKSRCIDFLCSLNQPSIVISHGVIMTVMRGILLNLPRSEMEKWDQPQGKLIHVKNGCEKMYSYEDDYV
jgi:probable phosphoglycerate mutase